jgi:hypothetical protein
VFCIYLRTNSDLCHLQHKLIGFYNRDEKCVYCAVRTGSLNKAVCALYLMSYIPRIILYNTTQYTYFLCTVLDIPNHTQIFTPTLGIHWCRPQGVQSHRSFSLTHRSADHSSNIGTINRNQNLLCVFGCQLKCFTLLVKPSGCAGLQQFKFDVLFQLLKIFARWTQGAFSHYDVTYVKSPFGSVEKKLQWDWNPWRWHQWMSKRVRVTISVWFNTHNTA